ncbi:hypothetical protein [Methanoculleus sp. UBA291]|uniref:hypothetical protein n=1 Tax=Methanoculleus sp. UBA291 TaxID=1915495 RepID=UPI00316AEAE6
MDRPVEDPEHECSQCNGLVGGAFLHEAFPQFTDVVECVRVETEFPESSFGDMIWLPVIGENGLAEFDNVCRGGVDKFCCGYGNGHRA